MDGAHACVDRDARKFVVLLKLDPGVADPEAWVCLHPAKNGQLRLIPRQKGLISFFDQTKTPLTIHFATCSEKINFLVFTGYLSCDENMRSHSETDSSSLHSSTSSAMFTKNGKTS